MELDAARFAETELREETWDPLAWVYLLGDGIFSLLAREFAPLARSAGVGGGAARGVPGDRRLRRATSWWAHAGRPVAKLHTETALRQLAGIDELIGDALAPGSGAARTTRSPRSGRGSTTAADGGARGARRLRDAPPRRRAAARSEGEGRLGPELFAAQAAPHAARSDLTPAEVLARAEREFAAVRAEMVRLARAAWPTLRCRSGRCRRGIGRAPRTRAAAGHWCATVLDAIGRGHQPAERLLQFCRDELARIEAFVRTRDLIGLADEPLEIRWTPVFLRSFGGAMLDSPGPAGQGPEGVLLDHADPR